MSAEPDLEQWNLKHLELNQAFLGAISSNIRMVWLDNQEGEWVVHVVLESEDATDREEIEDSVTQFEAFQDRAIGLQVDVIVKSGELDWPPSPARVIFRRRD